ncbi:hypothetical protein IFM89_012428 [Coptis chinensis]|uniref:Cell division cycle protein 123 homolog n=1 Tax=Coptis chinensis TaxID=261450 RepID=A0A835I7I9_9MAGN|nr:hypothetical protein IFM89_012428 [Coptis chinensis]
MREEEVNRCQIQEWYPKFKSVSIKTLGRIHNPEEEEDFQVSEQPPSPPSFPEFELGIKESIRTLGGAVFPKLNWSAPKDSAWISTTGNLRCTSFSEITLLLRSSVSLVHGLWHAYRTPSRPPSFFLALRKWYSSFHPEMEFRCFVRNQHLIAISQREVTGFYPVLLEKKCDLEILIQDFFEKNVQQKFELVNYTFDVYVTRDKRVKLLDFNPWAPFTLPLLFSWEELQDSFGEEELVQFRVVESQCAVRPSLKTAVPYDYLDTSPGSGWDQFLRRADEELQKQDTHEGKEFQREEVEDH